MILRFKAQEINIAAHISDRINCLRIAFKKLLSFKNIFWWLSLIQQKDYQ